jgi:hypothetical protein
MDSAGAFLYIHLGMTDEPGDTMEGTPGNAIPPANAKPIDAERLTKWAVLPGGTHIRLGFQSADFAYADLDTAVPGASMAVFANSGQICSAGTRLFVERKIYDEFTARVAAFSKTLRVGNSSDPATQVGPLVSSQQLERVTGYLSIGRQEGARPLSGGERLTEGDMAKGFLVPPTVFDDLNDGMRIAKEEIFGPVISAIPFTDIEEVIERDDGYAHFHQERLQRFHILPVPQLERIVVEADIVVAVLVGAAFRVGGSDPEPRLAVGPANGGVTLIRKFESEEIEQALIERLRFFVIADPDAQVVDPNHPHQRFAG